MPGPKIQVRVIAAGDGVRGAKSAKEVLFKYERLLLGYRKAMQNVDLTDSDYWGANLQREATRVMAESAKKEFEGEFFMGGDPNSQSPTITPWVSSYNYGGQKSAFFGYGEKRRKKASRKTLRETGNLKRAWTLLDPGPGRIRRQTAKQVLFGVDGAVIPYAEMLRGGTTGSPRSESHIRPSESQFKTLGAIFGYWMSRSKMETGHTVRTRPHGYMNAYIRQRISGPDGVYTRGFLQGWDSLFGKTKKRPLAKL